MRAVAAHTGISKLSDRFVVTTLVVILVGCTDTENPAHESGTHYDSGIHVGRMWASADDRSDDVGIREGSFSGVVESRIPVSGIGIGLSRDGAEGFEIRDDDSEQRFRLELALPLAEPVIRVGDSVAVSYVIMEGGPWAPTVGFVTIRDADEALIAWVGQSGSGPQGLSLPDGFAAEETRELRTYRNNCGTTTDRALRVTAGEADVELAVDTAQDVGGYVAMLGSNSRYVADPDAGCADTFDARGLILAIARR